MIPARVCIIGSVAIFMFVSLVHPAKASSPISVNPPITSSRNEQFSKDMFCCSDRDKEKPEKIDNFLLTLPVPGSY